MYNLTCNYCKWSKKTDGSKEDLINFFELKTCQKCSGRKFRCPECGRVAKLFKIRKLM